MVGIPSCLPKYITVEVKSHDGDNNVRGMVVDALDQDVPENIKQEYVSKYYEASENGARTELPAVVKTEDKNYIVVPVKKLATQTQSVSPSEAKQLNIEEELQRLQAEIDPDLKTNNGEPVSEFLRDLLYKISLKNKG